MFSVLPHISIRFEVVISVEGMYRYKLNRFESDAVTFTKRKSTFMSNKWFIIEVVHLNNKV